MSSLRLTALAAAACLAAAGAPASASSLAFTGIRPGTLLMFEAGNFCTANFVFQTTGNVFDQTQQLYLGTAGHCGALGESVTAVFVAAQGNRSTVMRVIGTIVVDDDVDDFALIELDPALNRWVSPSMAWWGGPTGVHPAGRSTVTWTGHGGFAGGAVPRVGQLTGYNSTTIQVANTADAAGDSGAPVTTVGGLAVGSLTGVDGLGVPAGTVATGPSIARMVALAGHPLAWCTSATPWPGAGCPAV